LDDEIAEDFQTGDNDDDKDMTLNQYEEFMGTLCHSILPADYDEELVYKLTRIKNTILNKFRKHSNNQKQNGNDKKNNKKQNDSTKKWCLFHKTNSHHTDTDECCSKNKKKRIKIKANLLTRNNIFIKEL